MNSLNDIVLPEIVPILSVPGLVLMPKTQLVVPIHDLESLSLIADAVRNDWLIGVIQPHESMADQQEEAFYKTGTLSKILEINDADSSPILLTLGGICRFTTHGEMSRPAGYRTSGVSYERYAADIVQCSDFSLNRERLLRALTLYFRRLELKPDWKEISNFSNEKLVMALSMACPFEAREKQALLEVPTLQEQSEFITQLLEISCFAEDGHHVATTTMH
jgi:Lon protease-like protein